MKRSFIFLVIAVISLSSLVLSKKMFQEENTKELTNELKKLKSFISINTLKPRNSDKQLARNDVPLNNRITDDDSRLTQNSKCEPEKVTDCIIQKNIMQEETENDLQDNTSVDWDSIIETLKNDQTISNDVKQCLKAFHCNYD